MNYEKACQSDILECIKLKNNVISHLKSIGVNIWDEDYPSDELIENDIMFSNARVVKNEGEIIAYLCFYDPNIEYNEYPFKEEKLYTFSRLMVKENYTGKHVGTFLVQNVLNEIRSIGAKGCGILVHPINKVAINFYNKIGFKFEQTKLYDFGTFHNFTFLF